jgi:hypothetical protein
MLSTVNLHLAEPPRSTAGQENSNTSQPSNQLLKIPLTELLDPQQLIVVLPAPNIAILLAVAEDTNNNEPNHSLADLIATMLQLLVRVLEQLLNRSVLAINLHTRLHLLSNLNQLVLRNRSALNIHSAVLGLLGVLQNANNSFADVAQEGHAVLVVSSIKDARRAALEIDREAGLHAPVEEQAVVDQGVADFGRLLLEVILGDDFTLEDGQSGRLRVSGDVRAEFGRDEALDSGGDGGVDESGLGVVFGDCGYEDVLAFEGVDEGVLRAVVDFHGFSCRGEVVCFAALGEDCDVEAGVDEGLHDCWAKVAGGACDCDLLVGHGR